MKKQILIFCLTVFSHGPLFAQSIKRLSPQESTEVAVKKLSVLDIDEYQLKSIKTILSEFYTSRQKMFEDMRASGSSDHNVFQSRNNQLIQSRDDKLRLILTADQMKKWLEEIEPALKSPKGNH
jgi:hypothetical protein